jgi:hypothetical protein
MMKEKAIVAMARYNPRIRRAGIPTINPMTQVIIPEIGRETQNDSLRVEVKYAELYAPMAKKATCPREINPVYPVSI